MLFTCMLWNACIINDYTCSVALLGLADLLS